MSKLHEIQISVCLPVELYWDTARLTCSHLTWKSLASACVAHRASALHSPVLYRKPLPTPATESRETEKNKAASCSVRYWVMPVLCIMRHQQHHYEQ